MLPSPRTESGTSMTESPARKEPARLEVRRLTKRFGPVTAVDQVDLVVERGTVHSIVGENGAGKTTLMKCIAGLLQPDAGEILVDGEVARLGSVHEALTLGIGMVHQEFSVVGDLTLAENLVLGVEPRRRGLLDRRQVEAATEQLAEQTGWRLPWHSRADEVGVADLQRFELLRQLHRGADLLILDEPTAVLGPAEVDLLLSTVTDLRDRGVTVLFISHKLDEVMRISDRVTVLRAGQVVESTAAADTSISALAEAMVGEELTLPNVEDRPPVSDEPVLEVEDLVMVDGRGLVRVDHVDLTVNRGEIVGVYGVAGSGQAELVAALTGLAPSTGSIRLEGEELNRRSVGYRRKAGMAFISPDRRSEGLALTETIEENGVAGGHRNLPLSGRLVRHRSEWRSRIADLIRNYSIKVGSPEDPAASLSGGNQQRLVVGRELDLKPKLLIASDPTRGVDIEGVAGIHELLMGIRRSGGSVLLVSHDLDEVLSLSDRIAVMLDGRVTAVLERDEATRSLIAEKMTVGAA